MKKQQKLHSEWSLKTPLYINKKDKMYKKHLNQLKKQGFSDTELWSLDVCISKFILPRLKRFKTISGGYPANLSEKKWQKILDKIIFSFEWNIEENEMSEEYMKLSEKKLKRCWEKYNEGIKLFAEYFNALWW